jgi:hypothetical protein
MRALLSNMRLWREKLREKRTTASTVSETEGIGECYGIFCLDKDLHGFMTAAYVGLF